MNKNNNKITNIILVVTVVFLIISAYFLYLFLSNQGKIDDCASKYEFIRPDIGCDMGETSRTKNLQNSVNDLIEQKINDKKAIKISVFYRGLNDGQWFGINENENFNPGSLLKLPLAIAYYKIAEVDNSILSQQFKYTKADSGMLYDIQVTKPPEELKKDGVYSAEELIERMMIYSDNEVLPILTNSIDKNFTDKVYVDMGVYVPTSNQMEKDFLSVKTYGAILRSLYNAGYLNQFYSNKLLNIMSQSAFATGIKAGVPKNIKVANKFGERIFVDQNTKQIISSELHDCGIIYKKDSPYILCIMTSGSDQNELLKVISEISEKIYYFHK